MMQIEEARQDVAARVTSSPPPLNTEDKEETRDGDADYENEVDVIQAAAARGRHDMARALLLWETGRSGAAAVRDVRRKDARVDEVSA